MSSKTFLIFTHFLVIDLELLMCVFIFSNVNLKSYPFRSCPFVINLYRSCTVMRGCVTDSLTFIETCFMAHFMANFYECFIYAWEKSLFFSFAVKISILLSSPNL